METRLHIDLEPTASALARVFSLLALLDQAPTRIQSQTTEGVISLELHLADISEVTADRLCRKVEQLIETIAWQLECSTDIPAPVTEQPAGAA